MSLMIMGMYYERELRLLPIKDMLDFAVMPLDHPNSVRVTISNTGRIARTVFFI
tara:strand:- start:74 stop:235 length:162 start_codon:yes stop_codon:yes gene_type:complete